MRTRHPRETCATNYQGRGVGEGTTLPQQRPRAALHLRSHHSGFGIKRAQQLDTGQPYGLRVSVRQSLSEGHYLVARVLKLPVTCTLRSGVSLVPASSFTRSSAADRAALTLRNSLGGRAGSDHQHKEMQEDNAMSLTECAQGSCARAQLLWPRAAVLASRRGPWARLAELLQDVAVPCQRVAARVPAASNLWHIMTQSVSRACLQPPWRASVQAGRRSGSTQTARSACRCGWVASNQAHQCCHLVVHI
jgi:hypothetical protein